MGPPEPTSPEQPVLRARSRGEVSADAAFAQLYAAYARMHLRYHLGRLAQALPRLAREGRTGDVFRAEYRRRQQPLLIACTWLGQNVHILLLGVAGMVGHPSIYLWTTITFLNLVLLGLVSAHEGNAGALIESLDTEAYAHGA